MELSDQTKWQKQDVLRKDSKILCVIISTWHINTDTVKLIPSLSSPRPPPPSQLLACLSLNCLPAYQSIHFLLTTQFLSWINRSQYSGLMFALSPLAAISILNFDPSAFNFNSTSCLSCTLLLINVWLCFQFPPECQDSIHEIRYNWFFTGVIFFL